MHLVSISFPNIAKKIVKELIVERISVLENFSHFQYYPNVRLKYI